MKKCIWCLQSEVITSFNNKAHTFPQSLGGKNICKDVCDNCNKYFGSPQNNSPAIEVVFKEILNISKYLLLYQTNFQIKKRYKSEYFNINWEKKSITIKPRYALKGGFKHGMGRLFKRGMYKVFLEERQIQKQDAYDKKFNFIREFSRYNTDDYPIYLLKPKFKAILGSIPDILEPTIRFTEHSDKLEKNFNIFEYMIMGHNFCIPTSKDFTRYHLNDYVEHLITDDDPLGKHIIEIKLAENVDYTFKYMNE